MAGAVQPSSLPSVPGETSREHWTWCTSVGVRTNATGTTVGGADTSRWDIAFGTHSRSQHSAGKRGTFSNAGCTPKHLQMGDASRASPGTPEMCSN